MTAIRTARERARAELTREIKDEARSQLAAEGPQRLSLRSVARELGMVSSALYRYFPSKDDLLTALIVDAYDSLGAAAERAAAATDPDDRPGTLARHLPRGAALGEGTPARVRPDLRVTHPRVQRTAGHRRTREPGTARPRGSDPRELGRRHPDDP